MKTDNSTLITNVNTKPFNKSQVTAYIGKSINVAPKLVENFKRKLHRSNEASRGPNGDPTKSTTRRTMIGVGDPPASSGFSLLRDRRAAVDAADRAQQRPVGDGTASRADGLYKVTPALVIPTSAHTMRYEAALTQKEALGRFLKELCDEDEDKESKRREILKKRSEMKGRDGKEILSKEFGKDGVKLKMRQQDDMEDREEVKRTRKVSFKVNNHHRKKSTESRVVINSNVATLASRYDSLAAEEVLLKNKDVKVLVSRRNSSRRDGGNVSVTYRPSILKSRITNVKAAIGLFEGEARPKEGVRFDGGEGGEVNCVEFGEVACRGGVSATRAAEVGDRTVKNSAKAVSSKDRGVRTSVATKCEPEKAKPVAKNLLTTSAKPKRVVNAPAIAKTKRVECKETPEPVAKSDAVSLVPIGEPSDDKLVPPTKNGVKPGPKPKPVLNANRSSLFPQTPGCKPAILAKPPHLDAGKRPVAVAVAAKIQPNKSNLFGPTIESVPKTQLAISAVASAVAVSDTYEVIDNKDTDPEVAAIKPNTSFLWGSTDAAAAATSARRSVATPLFDDIELTSDQEDSYEIALEQLNQRSHNAKNQGRKAGGDDGVLPRETVEFVVQEAEQEQDEDEEATYDDIHPPSSLYLAPGMHYTLLDEIYDDVGNLDTDSLTGYDYVSSRRPPPARDADADADADVDADADNIYDDVRPTAPPGRPDDTVSLAVSNCYESIYDVDGGGGGGGGDVDAGDKNSSGSSTDGKSFLEVDNSLYGGARFGSRSTSQASTASVGRGSLHDGPGYQMISPGQPRSDTSDEWMDLELSDSEIETGTFNVVVHDRRSRCKRSPSWSQRVRRQWSSSRKSPRRINIHGDSSESGSDHHYEMVVGVRPDDVPFDDFDSLDSDDEVKPPPPLPGGYNGRLPEPPPTQGVYAIGKMAEAAGNRLLKFSKTLSRMRPKRHTTEIRFAPRDLPNAPPLSLPPLPPLPPATAPSAAPAAPAAPEKASAPRAAPNRKYWSLRKFRRNSSAPAAETSTFYLTDAVDVDDKSGAAVSSERTRATTPALDRRATVATDLGSDVGTQRPKPAPGAPGDRRSSARPNSPPPLPPLPPEVPRRPQRKEKRASASSTSWYAECGLFDSNEAAAAAEAKRPTAAAAAGKERPLSDSWYADVGLWDRPGAASPKGSLSTCSPASESSAAPSPNASLRSRSDSSLAGDGDGSGSERRFRDEPLYQFYTESVVELARRGMNAEFDSDGYEEADAATAGRPSAMDLTPRHGQHRSLWCEIPEVINSCVLSTLSTHQKKLQEAKFEIISSEASYIRSLAVLEEHFISSPDFNDDAVVSKSDRRILFGNVAPVRVASRGLLAELERCWQRDILLHDVCDVVYRHATDNFNAYVKYCSNQIYLDRTLRRLKEQHGRFAAALSSLEASAECESLSLHSFLMLPMQRITRLPLLLDAVLTRLSRQDAEYDSCTLALATLNKVVKQCNEAARQMERMEEILILSHQLEFPKDLKAIPIISSTRWLVRSGELTQLIPRSDEAKLTFGRKFSKATLYIYLFTDLLVVTKKRSDECFTVVDYCPRNMVEMTSADAFNQLPVKAGGGDGGRNLVLLTLLRNHEHKTVEMMLSCGAESERQRWLQAVRQPTAADPAESVYEHWDCPQVSAVHAFAAAQPDELALDVADVVNVLRKTPDGWYYGQRIRDSEQGWFPGNHTVEVASAHVRARNLKQRYRLLALSGNFLDAQRKDKK